MEYARQLQAEGLSAALGDYAKQAIKTTRSLDDRIGEAGAIRDQISNAVAGAQEILNRLSGDYGHAENDGAECCDKPAGSIAQLADVQNDCQRALKRLNEIIGQIARIV
jgi:hypothetical protein